MRFWSWMNVEWWMLIMRSKAGMAVVGLRGMEMNFSGTFGDFGLDCWKF